MYLAEPILVCLSVTRKRARGGSSGASSSFLREVCLLRAPEDTLVPRGQLRLQLSQNGHLISGVQFQREWSAAQVTGHIRHVFGSKIPQNTQ